MENNEMKKRWIPVLLLALAVAVLIGVRFGIGMEYQRILEARDIEAIAPTAIAVVNSDTGVVVDGESLNYSAAIIETLGEGFALMSPAMAQSGLTQGIYSAILTFPSNVSERIVAFNTGNPERVQLEFRVNPELPESYYIRTHIELLNLQLAINLTVANTYVSSLFSQFHFAQDEMDTVFRNNEQKLTAMGIVELKDFTPDLELDILPYVEFEPEEADTSEHFLTVTGFAEQVRDIFSLNFELAATSYEIMREAILPLVGPMSEQRTDWIADISGWNTGWYNFANTSGDHFDEVLGHQGDLEYWRENRALPWFSQLGVRYNELYYWYGRLSTWYGDADSWYTIAEGRVDKFNNMLSDFNIWREGSGVPALEDALLIANSPPTEDDVLYCICECIHECLCLSCDCPSDMTLCNCDDCICSSTICIPGECLLLPPLAVRVHDPDCETYREIALSDKKDDWVDDIILNIESAILTNPEAVANLIAAVRPFSFTDLQTLSDFAGEPHNERPITEAPSVGPPPLWDFEENPTPPPAPLDPQPTPDELFASIYGIEFWLGEFSIEDYRDHDYLWLGVVPLLEAYYNYLEFIRADLSFQFMENVFMLFDVRAEYVEYLSNLRLTALESEYDVRAYLQGTLYEFFEAVNNSGQDTHDRLTGFTGMLPESRTAAGINQDVVNFTIAPFEFVTPFVRADFEIDTITVSDAFEVLLWVAVAILAIFLIIAVTLTTIEIVKKLKAESKS